MNVPKATAFRRAFLTTLSGILLVLGIAVVAGGDGADTAGADPPPLSLDSEPPGGPCPPGYAPEPPPLASPPEQAVGCAPVVDRRDEFSPPSSPIPLEGHFAQAEAAGAMGGSQPPPDPGVFDAGTLYLDGTLRVTYSATFSAYVEVYPWYNAEELVPYGVAGYYMTETNRTESGVEFLARFRRPNSTDPDGWLQIYDWSCQPQYPCDNGFPNVPGKNAFVRAWHQPDVPCWYRMLNDSTGHYVNYVYFRNSTWIVEPRNPPADPPLWRNTVRIWNYCTNQYEAVYTHDYAANQADCSQSCGNKGWWAGVAERFPANSSKPPAVAKQGFHHQTLDYDGQSTRLRPENSRWVDPTTNPPWQLYYLYPNDTWEAGTYQDDDGDDVPNTLDNCPLITNPGQGNNVHPATSLGDACEDPEPDGVVDAVDSCPDAANPGQANVDGDAFGDVCDNCPTAPNANQGDWNHDGIGDACQNSDGDQPSYNDAKEVFVGTLAGVKCPTTTTRNDEAIDAWPPDFNDDRSVGLADILSYIPVYLTTGNPRWDQNQSGGIGLADILAFIPVYLSACTP